MTRKNHPPGTIRCAIYTRKSTEAGLEQDFNSLDAQREACLAYIQSQRHEGWKCLPTRYDDGGFTGGNMDRPALKRLLADIEAGKVDCLVAYKIDRLSRSLLDFARIIGIFEKHHVSFVSITQQFNSATSMGRLVLNVLLSFAQFEREIISERTRDKIAATRRKGKWSGGLPVLGYDVDHHILRLVVNPKEATQVRAIFDLYLKHQALLPVVRELERRGWRTKVWVTRKGHKMGGQLFVKSNLHKLLTNATYAGKLRYKKELHNGEHPAVVDPVKWQKVQELLQRHRHRGSTERNESGAILKGLLYCRPCGCAMSPTYSSKGSKRYRYYVCSQAQKRGWDLCPSQSIPAGPIERIVVAQISKVGQDSERLQKILTEASQQRHVRLTALESDRCRLERELKTMTESLAPANASDEGNRSGFEAIQENIGHLQRRLAATQEQTLALQRLDPMWVLDANKAIVVTPGTTENEFSNTAMDLRMQVSGGTATYAWDTTGAPDITGVSGTSTYKLTFTWSSFTGAAKTETIIAKETPSGGSQLTQTVTFLVAGTNSPAWSTPPTTFNDWQNNHPVLTPDALTVMQGVQCCGSYGFLGLTAGDLQYAHGLPGYNPGVPALGLMYDSIAANPLPIFITHFQIDPGQAVPPTVHAQLTLNGVAGTTVWYSTSTLNPGDIMEIPLQGDATSLSTGRYSWSIAVTADYGTPVTTNYSGSVDIINSSSNPFGAGWSLNVLERIWPVTGGVVLELPGGLSLWFANGQTAGTFVTPPGETSTLAQNQSTFVYTRTLKDGTKINFNSSGYQTSIVDTNNNTLSFGYNGSNQLTTLTDFNSLVTTIAYNGSGKVTSITDPANRITTLAYDVGNTKLTGVTDPDSAVWGFGYDSSNRMTTLTDPRSKVTTYAYGTGRVTTVTRADNSTLLLTALELQGIPASGTGTQGNPATSVLAAQATAAYTDARNNVWNTRMDWLGFGEPTQQADPLGDLSNTYRDLNAFPWLLANSLGQRTRNFFEIVGNMTRDNITKNVFADDKYEQRLFNNFSEVTKLTDALNNVTTYSYDPNGNLTQIKDALSHITTMTYTSHGFLSTTTDPLSHTTTVAYDSRSRQASLTDPLGHTATMAYDSASNMTGQTDMRGNPTTYTFDNEGRLRTTLLPGNTNPTTNAYDAAGNLTAVTDPLGHTTSYGFDNLNRQITVTDALSHTATYGLDSNGNRTTVTDPLSRTTTYAFDSANRLTAVTDTLSHTTMYGLDAAGEQTTMTDPLSHVTSYQYDNRDRQTTTLDPLNDETVNGYDADSNKITMTRQQTTGGFTLIGPSETTTYTFDTVNRNTSMKDPAGSLTSYAYDSANRQTTTTDPLSHVSTTTYDTDDRVIAVTDALGHTTSYGYDNNGNRTTMTDPLGRTTTYAYDQQNRVTAVTDPLTGVTTYAYDQSSRQTSITDAVGNITTNAYDNANRLTTVTDPNGHLTTYAYDNANQLTSVTDRNGRQVTYSYDNAGRKTGETWVSGNYIATYAYDSANRLTLEQDTFSKYTLGYDNANRLTSIDNNGTPNAPHFILTYAYDAFSDRTSITDSSNGTVTLAYDSINRLTNISIKATGFNSKNNPSVTLAYDNASRLTSLTRIQGARIGSTVTTTFGYDNADRLSGITHKQGSTTLMTLTYGYDNGNQLTSYAGPDGSITYGYDNDGQMTSATGAHNETYTYDKEGNRTMTGYSTGTGNRLTADGTYTYAYDNDGNMTGRTKTSNGEITTFTWDFRNRLTEVLIKSSGGTTLQDDKFTYDVENRRIGKNTLGGQSWTAYIDANPYADFDGSGSLTFRYLYGNVIDFLLGRVDTLGAPMWYLTDKLGSVRENVDGSANVLDSITYDTYGNILAETSSGDRFKYTSREWDSEIGQYFYRARYYGPTIGRFESEDPLGLVAGDSDIYRYVKNAPTISLDPAGLGDKNHYHWGFNVLQGNTSSPLSPGFWGTAGIGATGQPASLATLSSAISDDFAISMITVKAGPGGACNTSTNWDSSKRVDTGSIVMNSGGTLPGKYTVTVRLEVVLVASPDGSMGASATFKGAGAEILVAKTDPSHLYVHAQKDYTFVGRSGLSNHITYVPTVCGAAGAKGSASAWGMIKVLSVTFVPDPPNPPFHTDWPMGSPL